MAAFLQDLERCKISLQSIESNLCIPNHLSLSHFLCSKTTIYLQEAGLSLHFGVFRPTNKLLIYLERFGLRFYILYNDLHVLLQGLRKNDENPIYGQFFEAVRDDGSLVLHQREDFSHLLVGTPKFSFELSQDEVTDLIDVASLVLKDLQDLKSLLR